MILCWRFILTLITTAIMTIIQAVHINIDVLVEYEMKNAKPTNSSYNFLTPQLFRTEQRASSLSYVDRFLMLHVTYFSFYFGSSLLLLRGLWKRRVSVWMLLLAMVILAIFTVTIPYSIRKGWPVYFDRAFQGFASGLLYPAVHDYLALWTPPMERGLVCSIVYSGLPLGVASSIWFTKIMFACLNWRYIFYLSTPMIVMVGFWMTLLVTPTPEMHRFISNREREYIDDELGHADKGLRRRPLALRNIFGWVPLRMTLFACFCFYWGWYVILFVVPLYLKIILGLEVFENIALTTLPFVLMVLFGLIVTTIMNILVATEIISVSTARKLAVLISSVIPLICFLLLDIADKLPAVWLVSVAITSMGARAFGTFANFLDVSPNYAGVLLTFAAWTASSAFALIFLLFYIALDFKSLLSYRIIFGLTSALYAIEAVCCYFFTSADEAEWNHDESE